MLERQGHVVISAMSFAEAMRLCRTGSFDLVVIGHSIPERDKRQFVAELRSVCSSPLLALLRQGESSSEDADAHLDVSEGPEVFLATISRMLRKGSSARRRGA